MNKRLLEQLQNFDSSITGLIQHSYNPTSHETIQFYVFCERGLKYIVSTYRTNSFARTLDENNMMKGIIDKTNLTASTSILFSLETLETESFLFRIQAYVEKSYEYTKKIKEIQSKYLQEILSESNNWIFLFQDKKTESSKDETLREDIQLWISENNNNPERVEFLEAILTLQNEEERFVKNSSHGDYCYWNYFKGINDKFYVFDWEFSKQSNWSFIDPITNVFVFWMDLYKQSKVSELEIVLTNPSTDLEQVLNQEFKRVVQHYEIDETSLYILILFVYCHLYLRQETFAHELPLFTEMKNLLRRAQNNIKKGS